MKIVIDLIEATNYSLSPYYVYRALYSEYWNKLQKIHHNPLWGMATACDSTARELYAQKTGRSKNVKNLILRLAVIGVVCVILVVMGNVLVYLFNPTINRAGDFSQYQIDFVTEITTIANLADVLSYKNAGQELTIVSSNKAILDKLKQNQESLKGMHFVDLQDVPSLLERDTVLLVEEYGVTRYKKFEQSLQILRNLNRSILGVATFKL